MTKALLGCIADDFTGATDLANMLVRGGMRAVQTIGVPASDTTIEADALIVALKSRTIPAEEAVAQSLAALEWLRAQGCRQFLFKYCSTFDSTDKGNIGPVADALLDALGDDFTIACPAFPENGRTIFRGNLFVGDVLLNESGMQNHPLTPMTDPNLVRVLQRQTKSKVGLIAYDVIAKGPQAVRDRIAVLRNEGVRMAVADAVSDADLYVLGEACADLKLITGGSGIALGLPRNLAIPANVDPNYYDLGLCGPLRTDLSNKPETCGLFRTPSLRNVARRQVFFHNGVVNRLEDAVRFYATRDTQPEKWYPRSADGTTHKFDDLPPQYLGNVENKPPFGGPVGAAPVLSESDVADLVAFLNTLTDGWAP